MTTSNTTSDLRNINRHSVFDLIYQERVISKKQISQALNMSLPTVTQNLKELVQIGYVNRKGLFESTGGRKAEVYSFIAAARISIGVIILKEMFHIVAADLYGNIQYEEDYPVPFYNDNAFFSQLGEEIDRFVEVAKIDRSRILGVCIALQGLVSTDRTTVIYSDILKCKGLTLQEISANIHFPCTLIHDTFATATSEIWVRKDIQTAAFISLNRYLGGSLILDGKVCEGRNLSSVLEHMRLYPNGKKCYCGKNGCFESYCSAYALQRDAGETLGSFFEALRKGDPKRAEIWNNYLHNLAVAINNIRMLIDCEFIIGGHLLQFMVQSDFDILQKYADEECPFDFAGIKISRSKCSDNAAAYGAALLLIRDFMARPI